jgi:hypothetical protein
MIPTPRHGASPRSCGACSSREGERPGGRRPGEEKRSETREDGVRGKIGGTEAMPSIRIVNRKAAPCEEEGGFLAFAGRGVRGRASRGSKAHARAAGYVSIIFR